MKSVLIGAMALVCAPTAITLAHAGQQVNSGATSSTSFTEQDKSVPGCLCLPAINEDDFKKRFDETTRRRWNDSFAIYRKWLKHVEILEFFGASDENQTFLTSARNVTPDDEVYLRVRRANPLRHSYKVAIAEAATPEAPLLTIAGAAVGIPNPFDVSNAGKEVKKDSDKTEGVKATDAVAPEQRESTTAGKLGASIRERNKLSAPQWSRVAPEVTPAQAFFHSSFVHLENARQQQSTYFAEVAKVRSKVTVFTANINVLARDIAEVEQDECFSGPEPCKSRPITTMLGRERSTMTVASVLSEHDQIAGTIAALSVPPIDVEIELELAEGDLERAKQHLLRGGMSVAAVDAVPDVGFITGSASAIRTKTTAMQARVTDLHQSMTTLGTRLQALQSSLRVARDRASNADVCLALGSFAAQTSIKVTVELTSRQTSPPSNNNAKLAKLARSLLAEIEKESKTIGTPASTPGTGGAAARSSTRAGVASTGSDAGAAGEASEKAEEESNEEGNGNRAKPPAPSTTRWTSTEFHVLRPIHVQTTLGYAVSWLAAPSFDFRSRPIPEVKNAEGVVVTPAMKEITPFALDRNERQAAPTVQFGLHIRARYPFVGPDASPYESIRPWERWLPFPTIGFTLSSPNDNLFLGAGINLSRGVLAVAGAHLGKVKRLFREREEDRPFTILAADDFKIEDIVDESRRTRFFLAVTIDSSTIGRLFSAVGTGDNGGDDAGKKKK